jgi:hypothetical protein
MITRHTHRDIAIEGMAIFRNQGTASRVMKRFLGRWSDFGIVSQVYTSGPGFSEQQMNAIKRYAKQNAAWTAGDVPTCEQLGLDVDMANGLIRARFKLPYDVDTASVRQLREMCDHVTIIANCMKQYFEDINATALKTYPDYVFRGLPFSCSTDLWYVGGNDLRGGSGVLEWCYDEQDAKHRLSLMQQHVRFTDLNAAPDSRLKAA